MGNIQIEKRIKKLINLRIVLSIVFVLIIFLGVVFINIYAFSQEQNTLKAFLYIGIIVLILDICGGVFFILQIGTGIKKLSAIKEKEGNNNTL